MGANLCGTVKRGSQAMDSAKSQEMDVGVREEQHAEPYKAPPLRPYTTPTLQHPFFDFAVPPPCASLLLSHVMACACRWL